MAEQGRLATNCLRISAGVMAVNEHPPAIRPDGARNESQECRLAGPIAAHNHHEATRFDSQVHVTKRPPTAEPAC
jgi:hypothetical protein